MTKILDLETRYVDLSNFLFISGYKKHSRGYIKEEPPYGRFHIIPEGRELILHYDIYVTGKDKEHFSLTLPHRESKEISRLVKITYRYPERKKKSKEKEQVFKLNLKIPKFITPDQITQVKHLLGKVHRPKSWRYCAKCSKVFTATKCYSHQQKPYCSSCIGLAYLNL